MPVGDVAGIAVDSADHVYLFNRGPHPVLVLDRDGNLLDAWGDGIFTKPHGAAIGPDDALYLTDNGDHTVRKFSRSGQLLLEIGRPGVASGHMSGEPFNRCTHSAVTPTGDILVSDGYGNARVHRYSAAGEYLSSWGSPGVRPGEFNIPHNIACDATGRIFVADRENHRVQIFDSDGGYLSQLNNMHRPSGMTITAGPDPIVVVGEMAPYMSVNRDTPNIGPRVTFLALDGSVLSTLQRENPRGQEPGQFLSPHAIALDSDHSLYVGDVGRADWASLFPGDPLPAELRSFQKLVRVPSIAPSNSAAN